VLMEMALRALDRHFADFICRESQGGSPVLRCAAALASCAVGNGSICLDLTDIAGREIQMDGEGLSIPALAPLQEFLLNMAAVGAPGDYRPLILDGCGRLYLYRYWKYEQRLAQILLEKAGGATDAIDQDLLGRGLERLFPETEGDGAEWQRIAALAAVRKKFCVISGGPGTGKTSTVVRILALLLEQAKGGSLRIALAAPTGKSAARLRESIRLLKEKLDCRQEIREQIPHEVATIHRLLGPVAGSVRFRFSAANPLPYDVVIVDEASMVALPLMAKLVTALTPDARLVLLGDRDQLASVEAGAVLGDICGGERQETFSAEFKKLVATLLKTRLDAEPPEEPAPPLVDALIILKKNYRFREKSGIGAVARTVNAGDGPAALTLLKEGAASGIGWRDMPRPEDLKKALFAPVVEGYRSYLGGGTVVQAMERFDRFRILCALRQGPYGVSGINAMVEEILAGEGLIDPRDRWYGGRPLLITVNDYPLKLFNGDIGLVFPDPEAGGHPRVHFPTPEGGIRKVSPVRLPAHETCYAMTIHKSQGSEFERLLMLLPSHDSQGLTRELVYTGATRARDELRIWGDEGVFLRAVARRTERKSGLRDALWTTAGTQD
jgi:exodeoxyribonuclease V alpha subunit